MQSTAGTKEKWVPFVFMAPALLFVLFVSIYPITVAIKWSLYQTHYLNLVRFVGIGNFVRIFGTTSGLLNIAHSVIYVFCSLLLAIPIGTGLAVLLNKGLKAQGVLRTIIVLPWVVSQTITALVWSWLINPNYGPITYLIVELGGPHLGLLDGPLGANAAVIAANVWNSYPVALVLVLAALQTIPTELYEAATVDGASGWRTLTKITIPLIRPTVTISAIMLSLEYFNMVTLLFVMTDGDPLSSTETVSLRAFKEGFQYWNIGLSSAFSIVILILNILMSGLYLRALKARER